MKQFNLEEYLKNPSRKVVTREGRAVKIHCTNYTGTQHIIAQVEGSDHSVAFDENGKYYIGNFDSKYDLFFAAKKHEGWVIIFKRALLDSFEIWPGIYDDRGKAEHVWEANPGMIECSIVRIEWEEEQ